MQHVNTDTSECKILFYLQLADLLVKFLKMFDTKACKMETSAFSCGIWMQVFLCVLWFWYVETTKLMSDDEIELQWVMTRI